MTNAKTPTPNFPDSDTWSRIAADFHVQPGMTYLNHGSFGIPPTRVRLAQREIQNQADANPMDFNLVRLEPLLERAKSKLAEFIGTTSDNLVFVDNATYAMSIVAEQFPLAKDDQIVVTDHEYVPVTRMWQQRCGEVGANLITATLPAKIQSNEQVIESLIAHVTPRTKLLVISHITSPTGLILPIEEICNAFAQRGVAVCVDGPHAPAQVNLNIDELGCDFFAASCHKWLSGPLGTGFLYVHPKWQSQIQPLVKGWGRLPPAVVDRWCDQFLWAGTRDVSSFLAIPTAIDYLSEIGLENFQARTRWLASYAESALRQVCGTDPIAPRDGGWYGSMAHIPLPPGDWTDLQKTLKANCNIEIMINRFADRWFVRASCHLYNDTSQIDYLTKSFAEILRSV